MLSFTPLQSYQRILLDKTWNEVDIPTYHILCRMSKVLPYKYVDCESNTSTTTAEQLKHIIIAGGTALYNYLISVLPKPSNHRDPGPGYPHLALRLQSHGVPELYRHIWIWSEDTTVMKRGDAWYIDSAQCIQSATPAPGYMTWDGPGSPTATLCVESVAPCNVFAARGSLDNSKDLFLKSKMCISHHI